MAPSSLIRKLMNPKKKGAPAKKAATATRRKKKRTTKKKSAATAKAATPKKKHKTKKLTKPTGDVCEYSPTGRAVCQRCNKKIQQGQARVGKEEFYQKTQSYIHRFYHVPCYQREFPDKSPNLKSKRSIQDELNHLQKEQAKATKLIHKRADLKRSLEDLRKAFAKRLKRSAIMVFSEATLDDLIVKLPRNKKEMLKVRGIAEQRYENFGTSILQVIHQYRSQVAASRDSKRKAKNTDTTKKRKRQPIDDDADYVPEEGVVAQTIRRAAASRKNGSGKAQKQLIVIDDSDDDFAVRAVDSVPEGEDDDDLDDEDGVMMGKSLSAEEIVQRKFDHAAANNYIISVD